VYSPTAARRRARKPTTVISLLRPMIALLLMPAAAYASGEHQHVRRDGG